MTKIFGLPIIIAILLGISFPYFALSLIPLAFAFLFLLMIWAGFTIEWNRIKAILRQPIIVIVGLIFLFCIFPILQWVLARFLVRDIQFLYGLVFASLTPSAIVAPFFTQVIDGDEELSFLLMVSSMLLCPIISPLMLNLLIGELIPIQTWPLFKYMVLLITVPLMISFLISSYAPSIKRKIHPHLPLLNMISLSILIFVLWGNAISRLNLSYTMPSDIAIIIILVFFQDFGILFISRLIFSRLYQGPSARALAISLSMKNVAIAAGLLLFYDPRASFPPAMAFIAHAFLFNFIPVFRKRFIKQTTDERQN